MRSPGAGDVAGVTTGVAVAAAVGVAAGVGCAVAMAVGIGCAAADGPGVMGAAPALHPTTAMVAMATATTPRRHWDWSMTVRSPARALPRDARAERVEADRDITPTLRPRIDGRG